MSHSPTKSPPVVLKRQNTNREGEDLAEPLPSDTDIRNANVVLYGFDFSPPVCKVRALLHYYEVPYEYVQAMPGQKKDELDDSYKKIPKLLIDDRQINDSAVIIRTLAPLLTGAPMTMPQILLENDNNIKGFMGALEKETASSFFGVANAVRAGTSSWKSTTGTIVRPVLPYAAGLLATPLTWTVFKFVAPHGRDGTSLEFGHKYRAALGEAKFFSGVAVGPLDLSIYGTLKCFMHLQSPAAAAVLSTCDLRDWYERVDAAVNAVRPIALGGS